MSMERDELHRMLDEIPEGKLSDVRRLLMIVQHTDDDPVRRALANAPLDDEPETEEERQKVAEAEADLKAGRTMSTEELKRELGI